MALLREFLRVYDGWDQPVREDWIERAEAAVAKAQGKETENDA